MPFDDERELEVWEEVVALFAYLCSIACVVFVVYATICVSIRTSDFSYFFTMLFVSWLVAERMNERVRE